MFNNYLKSAVRNLFRYKGHALINITGLTLGLASCLLIYQYVSFEFSFDDFHVNGNDIYRLNRTVSRDGRDPNTGAMFGYAFGPALKQNVPELYRYARVHPDYDNAVISPIQNPNLAFEEKQVFYVDPAFLQMFSFQLISGNVTQALVDPGTILLSETAAQKYFGTTAVVGKMLRVTGWISGDFRIDAVFRDVPGNSHLLPQFLLPIDDLIEKGGYTRNPNLAWNWANFLTYVQLREETDVSEVEQKLTDILLTHQGDSYKRMNANVRVGAQPLHDLHLNDAIFAPKTVMGSYRIVYYFAITGLAILLIALVNYVNLTMARSMDRSREIGIRKMIGALRKQLIIQFLFESMLISLASATFAIVIAELLHTSVSNLTGSHLAGLPWHSPHFWSVLLLSLAFCTLSSGIYPAFVLSSYGPIAALKGKAGTFATKYMLRRGLVVLQFAVSIILIAGTAIVHTQVDFMRQLDLGISLKQIVTIPGPRVSQEKTPEAAEQAASTLVTELRKLPGIEEIATSNALPGQGFNWYSSSLRRLTADPSTGTNGVLAWIDSSFARLYGLELLAGRDFGGISASASRDEPLPVIANETAIDALGFQTMDEAIDQLVVLGGRTCRVLGIFKDFNWSSAHTKREAALFAPTSTGNQFSLKINAAGLPQTISAIERIYTSLFPGNPFKYSFLDQEFAAQYRNDERFAALFQILAALAILIACLGLLGLSSLATRQRTKEIGIRKILGASTAGVVHLLSKDFVKLVLMANFLAWPVAWFVMNKWLENFAYRIHIAWWMFLPAAGLALIIAFVTVSTQAIRASLANPADTLRYE